jgi:hypothetical protein
MVTASFTVAVYQMTLGTPDAITGIYPRTYVEVSARVAIVPKGTTRRFFSSGFTGQYDKEGVTKFKVNEGDIIVNSYGTSEKEYWMVMARQSVTWGNVLMYYQLDLANLSALPFMPPIPGGGGGVYVGYDPASYEDDYEYSLLITVP